MRIIDRYRNLPGECVFTKTFYALYVILSRYLKAREIIDVNGLRVKPLKTLMPSIGNVKEYSGGIICLTGFGHSGSGAVADLLNEYDGVQVVAKVDKNGSLRKSCCEELDILSGAGGLLGLERAFETRNERQRDADLKTFLRMVASLYVDECGLYNDDFIAITREFINQLVKWRSPVSSNGKDMFCPHLHVLGNLGPKLIWKDDLVGGTCWLREIPVGSYRAYAAKYISRILGLFSQKDTMQIVLDQFATDGSCDIEKYESYLGTIRLLAVFRDPRDVYVTGRFLKENWIPSTPDFFIDWYLNRVGPYVSCNHRHFKLIKFESLVNEYSQSVREIEDFLGLSPINHMRKKQCFDPAISKRNIGLYNQFSDKDAINYIYNKLRDYCY